MEDTVVTFLSNRLQIPTQTARMVIVVTTVGIVIFCIIAGIWIITTLTSVGRHSVIKPGSSLTPEHAEEYQKFQPS